MPSWFRLDRGPWQADLEVTEKVWAGACPPLPVSAASVPVNPFFARAIIVSENARMAPAPLPFRPGPQSP
jgi:hypothetical protein